MLFEREDWKLFRNIETLPQKAGVSKHELSRLICKELADNALDVCGACEIGFESGFFYVRDQGPGLDPELFAINRPLRSSKYLRLPTRGALGNGLRVAAGAVIATNGELYVSTRGICYRINFRSDGTAAPEILEDYSKTGTEIRFHLGQTTIDPSWARLAVDYARGPGYPGKTSPWWYTSENFFELFQASASTVSDLLAQFDGCSGGKAGKIAGTYRNTPANSLSFVQTETLLSELRTQVKKVSPERLGRIGGLADWNGYAKSAGGFTVPTLKGVHNAEIPYVLETYANPAARPSPDPADGDDAPQPSLTILLNKSPVTGGIDILGDKTAQRIFGCGLHFRVKAKPAKFLLNLITPYIPLVTDGKEPDFSVLEEEIKDSIAKAAAKVKKISPAAPLLKKRPQKTIVAECLEEAAAKASGNGEYRFSLRQLYYAVRPYVLRELDKELDYTYFCKELVSEYEAEHGDIPLMYRDDRGTLYHPHLGQDIPVGTIAVENYRRPPWTFNKVLYIEKEGFFHVLKENKIPEKYDMALLTSKGYASRAVKDLLDALGENSREEITFFCIHDADAYGTLIYDTLQNETKARPGRKVRIINLGLDPEEAVAMGLESEKVENPGRRKAVAGYIPPAWAEWLQGYRVELNAMSTPQFLGWLEEKIRAWDQGKVIPPEDVMLESLEQSLETQLGEIISAEILKQGRYQARVTAAVRQVKENCREQQTRLAETVREELADKPASRWKDAVRAVGRAMIKHCRSES